MPALGQFHLGVPEQRVGHANQSQDALPPMQRWVIQMLNAVVLAKADQVVDQQVGMGLDVVRSKVALFEHQGGEASIVVAIVRR